MKTNQEIKQEVIDLIANATGIDANYFLKNQEFTTFEEIEEILNDQNALDVEIIYYSSAIEFLKENDPSLRESFEIASEFGYELKNLNSEILASLLASQYCRESFNEVQSEVEELLNELEY